jgi:hypothetical protein
MRYEDQGCAAIPFEGEDEIDYGRPGRLVEISGRLIGNENGGSGGHCASNRNALLLAARQLRWIMRKPILEAHRSKLRTGLFERRFSARQFKGDSHIFECGHGRNKVEGLEYDANPGAAKARERIFAKLAEANAIDYDCAAVGLFEARNNHQKG